MGELFATFGIDWKLLLMQAVNFGVLLGILWYFLYTPVLRMIDDRREKIAEGVRTADAAKQELASAKEERDTIVGDAAKEAQTLIATSRERAEGSAAEIVKAAQMRADAELKDAKARAEEAKRQALKQSEKEIARAAMLAAEKILREKNA